MLQPNDFDLVCVNDAYIFLQRYTGDGQWHPVEISRDGFDEWMHRDGRREWCDDQSDHTGNHVQRTGEMTADQYYEHTAPAGIILDVIDYYKYLYTRVRPTNIGIAFDKIKSII